MSYRLSMAATIPEPSADIAAVVSVAEPDTGDQEPKMITVDHFPGFRKTFIGTPAPDDDENEIRSYTYRNVERRFHSPLVNDFNLYLCGSWHPPGVGYQDSKAFDGIGEDDEVIYRRVLNSFKPVGNFPFYAPSDEERAESDLPSGPSPEEALGYAEVLRDQAIAAGCLAQINERKGNRWPYNLTVARPGALRALFDLDALEADYLEEMVAHEFREEISEIFERLRAAETSDYLGRDPGFNNGNAIETGLILGYPIWSTMGLIRAHGGL